MVQEQIIDMLAEKLGCEKSEITADSTFSDLGIDSLDIAELIMNVEDKFGVSLEMDPSLKTVGSLVAKVESLKEGQ